MLAERGWTEEEFEVGFQQGVAPRQGSQHFVKYEALVQRELAKGEVGAIFCYCCCAMKPRRIDLCYGGIADGCRPCQDVPYAARVPSSPMRQIDTAWSKPQTINRATAFNRRVTRTSNRCDTRNEYRQAEGSQ